MGTLIKQECFKLFKKKSTFIAPIVFILLMVAQGYIATKYNEIFTPQESFTSAYNGFHGLHFINYSSKYNHFNGISLRYD